jgi:voltage-gated potassium channel
MTLIEGGRVTRLWRRGIKRSILFKASVVTVVGLSLCAVLFYFAERNTSSTITDIWSSFNWLFSTLLQQFSSDKITTPTGHLLYFLVLLISLGFVATATATIASKLLGSLLSHDKGMGTVKTKGHIVICGWNSKGDEILAEIRADKLHQTQQIVILASLDTKPVDDEFVDFVHGHPSHTDDLHRAGIENASTAIILADEGGQLSPWDSDAKTILRTLAVEALNPACYVVVEVLKAENRQHFERTKADELIITSAITGALLASAAVTHGISRVVTDLLTHPAGNEFYSVVTPAQIVGMTFGEALGELKSSHNSLLIGLSDRDGSYHLNPPENQIIESSGKLLVIATSDGLFPVNASTPRSHSVTAA